jgi:micrococcal nuclease
MLNSISLSLWALVFLCTSTTALAASTRSKPYLPQTIHARVTHVTDGDTLWAQPSGRVHGSGQREAIKIRIEGIDAPEICQAWGEQSRNALRQAALYQPVTLHLRGHDHFGRWIGKVELHGQDLGEWLIAKGHAWSYTHRRRGGAYEQAENQAREARRGLFSQAAPVQPSVFRKRKKCHDGVRTEPVTHLA